MQQHSEKDLQAYYKRRASQLLKLAEVSDNALARDHVIDMANDYLARAAAMKTSTGPSPRNKASI